MVRNDLPDRQVDLKSKLEVVGAGVEVGDRLFRFILIYLPGSYRISPNSLKGIFCEARTLGGGDFNATNRHWGCKSTNVRGRMLGEVVQEVRGLGVGNRRGKIIDFFLAFRMASP